MDKHLKHLAQRVVSDPFFLAAPLDQYRRSEGLDDPNLAAHLKCSEEDLVHLRLCRNPTPEPPRFWQDVEKIATRFNADPDALAEIIRRGHSLMKMQETSEHEEHKPTGFLMAARDKETEQGNSESAS